MKLILQAIKALFRKIEASRTHWEEVEEVEILTETTVTIPEDNSNARLTKTTQLTVGQTYFVILDGVSYECAAWYSYDEEAVIIGNGYIFGGEGGNGEPFSCDSYPSGSIYLNTEKAGTYTISISTKENIVHKLDKKYLPDEVIDSIDNAQTTANNAQTTANDAIFVANEAQTTANKAQTTANSKMNASNPVGTGSFSMGRKADSVVGTNSHAEGKNTTASGSYSHAEGVTTTASGEASHAECLGTTASGYYSHAEGGNTTASGNYSHTEGLWTTASGNYSHTEGLGTTASGESSHTEGLYTIAKSSNQHVQGKYNVEDSQNKYAHIIGNGVSSDNRSNAHTLDWSGNAWFAGTVEGTALIIPSSTKGSTKKFKITVDDSGIITATEVS